MEVMNGRDVYFDSRCVIYFEYTVRLPVLEHEHICTKDYAYVLSTEIYKHHTVVSDSITSK